MDKYINYCAIKVQKVFKGQQVRKNLLPTRKAFHGDKLLKLQAIATGWRLRRILKLKDTQGRIALVREHTDLKDVFTARTLKESRTNCVEKLISYIRNMEHMGSWLLT